MNKLWTFAFILILAGCSDGTQSASPLLNLKDSQGVIYGDNSLTEVRDQAALRGNPRYELNRQASVALFFKKDLTKTDQGYTYGDQTVADFFNTCPDYKYSKTKNPASCSGTLIAPNLVLTAGHCMNTTKDSCADTAFVFGFEEGTTEFPSANVYNCKRKYAESFFEKNTHNDYTIVELDRPVEGVTPISLNSTSLAVGQSLYTIGYSMGTPKKYAEGTVRAFDQDSVITTLDEYFVNSGGPIYDKTTHELVGIVNGGEDDFEMNQEKGCYEPKVCKEDECMGEVMMPLSVILQNLKDKGLSL
ncbi:MAG: trypsin-like peptidase domain-containing protein [Bdellovibrio sp.]|nr:trypsin-like peptidase domain-containing protein [Bdellovibrio sp.]